MSKVFRYSSIALFFLVNAFILFSLLVVKGYDQSNLFIILGFIFSAYLSRYLLVLLPILLPVLSNRPGSDQAYFLLILTIGINLGLYSQLVIPKFRRIYFRVSSPLHTLVFYFVLVSLLSLVSLPFVAVENSLKLAVPTFTNFSLYPVCSYIVSFLRSSEETLLYPPLTVLIILQAYGIYLWISAFVKDDERYSGWIMSSLVTSFFVTILFGLLDYFKIISLLGLRDLDPTVNAGGRQYRMQSFFGHSGWFAEFLTVLAPFSIVVLNLKLKRFVKLFLLVALLILGEVALIMSYQRGGWISYPLTLGVVWWAIYYSGYRLNNEGGQKQFYRQMVIKILVSLPLTILVSFLLVLGVSKLGLLNSDYDLDFGQYAYRFKEISKVNDRAQFYLAGLKLFLERPFFGNGNESFALFYRELFMNNRGKFYNTIILPLHGSAHNLYFQILTGKGIAGIITFLSLFLILIYKGFREAVSTGVSDSDRYSILALVCSLVGYLIYGNVQEFFYVSSFVFLLFISLALLISKISINANISSRFRNIISGSIFGCFILHLAHSNFIPGSYPFLRGGHSSYGCYPKNPQEDFFWCSNRAEISFDSIDKPELIIELAPLAPGEKTLQISCGEHTLSNLTLKSGEQVSASLDLSKCESKKIYKNSFNDFNVKTGVSIKFLTDYYIIPKRDLGIKDNRILSFKIFKAD